MTLRLHRVPTSSDTWKSLLILGIFVLCGVLRYRTAQGDDLGSSYVGCRLIATQHADHLYSYDPSNFAAIGPDEPENEWQTAADEGGFESFLHPYVQTPLWAYALQPLCTRTQYPAFETVFAILTMLSFAAFLWLVVRLWAPDLARPAPVALLSLGLWFSESFRYAMMLMQTHILLMLLTVAALILAERRRPVLAGLLLALAAAVKITPAIFIIYWLLTRRHKAATSMVIWSAVLAAVTLATTGPDVMAAYLANLHRISHVLLLSQNNQSFAAWAMSLFYPRAEIAAFHILPLPTAIRLGSSALMVTVTAAAGWIDRREQDSDEPPIYRGAAMTLVAATLFAPIAWTHYSFILIVPLLALIRRIRIARSPFLFLASAIIVILNFRPLATDVVEMQIGSLSIIRGQFFAGVLCLIALGATAWQERHRLGTAPSPTLERIPQHVA